MLVLANAVVTYNSIDPSGCEGELGKFWKSIWVFLESADSPTRKSAAGALDMISKCFTDSLIKLAIQDHEKSTLGKIISQCQKALDSLSFARSFSELLFVISSIISRLRYRSGPRGSPSAAEILMTSIIQKVGDLRMQKNFEYKEAADATLSSAIRVLGPQAFLKLLPLNLEPADR
jgi:ribosomal RNA-processing protein 12